MLVDFNNIALRDNVFICSSTNELNVYSNIAMSLDSTGRGQNQQDSDAIYLQFSPLNRIHVFVDKFGPYISVANFQVTGRRGQCFLAQQQTWPCGFYSWRR